MSRTANSISDLSFEDLLSREWLSANALGGYSSSTVCGLNTRRYHGLLVAAMTPPVRRMVLLSRVEETVRCDGREYDLACNEYPGTVWPHGHEFLRAFSAEPYPRWAYQGDGWTLQKELRLLRGQNTVVITYTLLGGGNGIDLSVRPLLALRGMHELSYQWNGKLEAKPRSRGHWHVPATRRTPELFFAHDGTFDRKAHWYLNQIYRREGEYGYSGLEDLWSPGAAQVRLMPGQTVHFACSADPFDLPTVVDLADRQVRDCNLHTGSGPFAAANGGNDRDEVLTALCRATEEHLLINRDGDPVPAVAQFHWSPPSIRAALVGFTGLFLVPPGRKAHAGSILMSLSTMLRGGMLASDFASEDDSPTPRGADVALWFVNAVREFAVYGGDESVVRAVLPAVLSVLDNYRRGTHRGIGVDSDGLLLCGSPDIAATWMDTKVAGQPVNPRYGRAVEINALWYNAQKSAAELCRWLDRSADADAFESSAAQTRHAFNERFWNPATSCCYDVVGDGGVDAAIRPNQLLAISLPFPVLLPDRWERVVTAVKEHLLTPTGVRTLATTDARYHGRYRGPVSDRDRAAHNGAAYPWLLGPLVTAIVRSAGPGRIAEARTAAKAILKACIDRLSEAGHLFELTDGHAPHAPGGAVASALSVAELSRCYSEDVLARRPGPPTHVYATAPIRPVASSPDLLFPA